MGWRGTRRNYALALSNEAFLSWGWLGVPHMMLRVSSCFDRESIVTESDEKRMRPPPRCISVHLHYIDHVDYRKSNKELQKTLYFALSSHPDVMLRVTTFDEHKKKSRRTANLGYQEPNIFTWAWKEDR